MLRISFSPAGYDSSETGRVMNGIPSSVAPALMRRSSQSRQSVEARHVSVYPLLAWLGCAER